MIGLVNINSPLHNQDFITPNNLFDLFAGNTGNALIGDSIRRNFTNNKTVFSVNNLYNKFSKHDVYMLNKCDHIFVVFKDFLRFDESYDAADADIFSSNLELLNKEISAPLTILSLGLNHTNNNYKPKELLDSVPKYFTNWLKAVNHKTYKICTRGYRSAELLDILKLKNILPLGCPSYYYSKFPKAVIDNSFENEDFMVFNGIFCNKLATNHVYTIQDERVLFDMANGKEVHPDKYKYFYNMSKLYANNIIHHSKRGRVKYFSGFSSAKLIYGDAKLSIGSRIHGAVAGLSNGVPSIVTNQDLRATEMCEFMNVPHLPEYGFVEDSDFGESLNIKEKLNEIDFDLYNKTYSNNYKKFTEFKDELLKIL